ncbi:MAG: serine/threonine protein kinase, partial [Acidobacteria bacterium]|nr:serine/threonine protein kinase [Acidobacteriota bacterium]
MRYARLDEECGGDEDFRTEVESTIRKLLESQKTDILSNDYEKAIPVHYRLVELLGRGGMAEVFRAKDARLDRSVAIKFLNSEFRKDPERMRRFNQEARAVSALNHPNIIVIHDVGENEGIQFIVTEFVDGETLTARINRGSMTLNESVEIAIQIASALAASHKAGIVHRDIKPDNVMIRRDGVVKVLDFGLAKESIDPALSAVDANAATLDKALTSPGLILGTPQYMSPE